MAEAAAGAVVEEAVKLAVPPIKRGFNYLCCFTSNIKNLKDEAAELEAAEEAIKMKVETALNAGRVKDPTVDNWLAKAKKEKDEKTAISDQVPNAGSVCLNLQARFSLSKRATKTTYRMKELRDECSKFGDVSLAGPPAASKPIQLGNAYEFESRKQIEEDIMAVLKGGDVSIIGIYGMGGLGKTTMAKRIMNRVLEEHVCEEAVFAVVSQPVDKLNIQLEIGGSLGLNLEAETSEAGKKQKLHDRLSGTKRILLVLDDVWKRIELEEFGIPCDSKGCTILITSRDRDVLHRMDVQEKFGMRILSDEDARILFRKKAGTCINDAELEEGIVKRCGGLPIAIATVGAALKDKSAIYWSNALRELSQRVPDHIDEYIANVYSPLRLSYDFLSSQQDKSIFLLCSLFPEDAYIHVEKLICFGVGLGIFEGIRDLKDARGSLSASITRLRGRSLLLDGEESDDYVRMHDIVRDVCIFIAKEEDRIEGDNCSWISSFEQLGFRSHKLSLLFLGWRPFFTKVEELSKLDNTIFEGISDLRVLCIHNYWSLTSLPPTHSLKNLKTLVLYSCHGLDTISAVGKFVNLEILICHDSPLIEELPLGIKELVRLKLLELTRCKNLQRIGEGIISSLLALEELKMLDSFRGWESEDREERKNARIRELESLTNLRCLEIDIKDPALASEMRLSSKIKKFKIRVGRNLPFKVEFGKSPFNKKLIIDFESKGTCVPNSNFEMQFLHDTEDLYLTGNDASSVDLAKCRNIRGLELRDCKTITLMVDDASALQASLERLMLDNLPMLEGICEDPISSDSFHNLKELKLVWLPALKQLWKSSSGRPLFPNVSSIEIKLCGSLCTLGELSIIGKDCLPRLEELTIERCEMMEQVFLWNKEDEIRKDSESQNDHSAKKVFPKLKKVKLWYLSNLATFYQGMGGFDFPLLTGLSIKECPKLKGMGCSVDIDDKSSHLLCQPKVSFSNLKKLEVDRNPFCGHEIYESLLNGLEVLNFSSLSGNTSLFSSSVAKNLGKLRVLNIRECDEVLKVIEDNKEEGEEENVVSGTEMPLILFPKLEELLLHDLPKLLSFCEWKCDIELPSLRTVIIKRCPDMKKLCLGFLAAPKLVHFDSDVKNNLETEVSFDSLKKLVIVGSEKPLYGHKFFNGLKELRVYQCSMSFLFTASTARHFNNIEVLIIQYCHNLVKVIEDEENEEKVGSGGGERTLLFLKLKKLELENLPNLVSFCEWKCENQLPSLRNLVIKHCPVLGIHTKVFKAAPYLENVEINLKDIVGDRDNFNGVLQQLKHTARVKVSFNDLENFSLHDHWNPFCGHQIPSSLLNGLKHLTFFKLHNSTSLFSSSVAGNLVNLRSLKITYCDEILKVIEDKKDVEEEKVVSSTAQMAHILFPRLEELSLDKLPKLVSFCKWKCNDELPSLREVTIKGCPNMEILSFSRVVAAPNLEAFTTDFTHNLEIGVVNVSFDSLKKLVISSSEKPLYGHKFLNGLKELEVSNCDMSCLFMPSTARCFDNLEVLSIIYSEEMVKVIEDEENEEKVASGGERTLLFPKLKELRLEYLPKLESFCKWESDIEFPSLRDVNIYMCPDLRFFTMGSIAVAPNLVNVQINSEDVGGGTNDMNMKLHANRR